MSGKWITLPVVSVRSWPPIPEARAAWAEHYRRRLSREGNPEALQRAVEYEQLDEHPYVRDFHLAALKAALASRLATREDIIRAVEQDQAEVHGGGRVSVAKRFPGMSASALYRRWQKVAGPDVPWPSGKPGPRRPKIGP